MDYFLNNLAERKHRYYHELHVFRPQAYTIADCQRRIDIKTRYDEVLAIINHLPLEQEKIVNQRFEELKNS